MVEVNWKQIVGGGIGLIAAVATILGVGYAMGKDHNEALVSFLREKNQAFESTERNLRNEVESLKLDLKAARDGTSSAKNVLAPARAQAEASSTGALASAPDAKVEYKNPFTLTLTRGNTAQVFDEKLFITLQGLSFEGSPLRHRVFAIVGKSGKPNKELAGVDPGFALIYEGFEIRVIETDTFFAKFLVTRLDAPKS